MGMIILLAVSVSLDVLGIGVAYTLSGIRIPWGTRVVITIINVALTFGAVYAGQRLGTMIPEFWFRLVGGAVLAALGGKTLWNAMDGNATADYDRDDSHTLDPFEGTLLGVTLALDAMCAGLGIREPGAAAYTFPLLTGSANIICLSIGDRICCNLRRLNTIAGIILIILGVIRFLYG